MGIPYHGALPLHKLALAFRETEGTRGRLATGGMGCIYKTIQLHRASKVDALTSKVDALTCPSCHTDSPHRQVIFDVAASKPFPVLPCVFHFTGNVFSTGKQHLAPLELIFAFFYGMLSIFQWSGEWFTISVRLLRRFMRR